jgi:NAD(P)H-flavin reductase
MAPLAALAGELPPETYDFYGGFRRSSTLLAVEAFPGARELVIATEDGSAGKKGLIPNFLDPAQYGVVYACGPEPMLRVVAASCAAAGTPCLVSLERRMACGVGACLGCAVKTTGGNRRCCADGPVFSAGEVFGNGAE